MSANTTRGHVREHRSLLSRVEKRTLVWIAERLPRAVNSDHLSALGLAGMALAGGAFWASHRFDGALVVVVAALAVNWFGDSLDGTLARVRNQQRPMYGFYVDHVIDVAGAVLLFGGLGLSPYMTLEVALALTVAYMMLSAEAYLATHARGVFRMAMFKVGPTELRILLAFGTLSLYYKPTVVLAGSEYLLFDVGGVVATAGMAGTFVVSAVRNTLALYRAEPLPRADQPHPRERPVPAADNAPGGRRASGDRTLQSKALASVMLLALTVGGVAAAGAPASAAELHPRTVAAWNDYVASTEQRIARELSAAPKALLVGQPTRGVDIGAIEFIHAQLLAIRDTGCAILLVSVELDEIMSLADRILVMNGGRIVGEVDRREADANRIGLMMAGIDRPATGAA